MRNLNPNQLSLNFVSEPKAQLKLKSPKPFLLSEKVKRILFKRGYSHVFNYPDYKFFKSLVGDVHHLERANAIADMFVENTSEASDLSEYIN